MSKLSSTSPRSNRMRMKTAGALQKYPSKIGGALVPDAAGFFYIDRSQFKEVFAADVSERVLSVSRRRKNQSIRKRLVKRMKRLHGKISRRGIWLRRPTRQSILTSAHVRQTMGATTREVTSVTYHSHRTRQRSLTSSRRLLKHLASARQQYRRKITRAWLRVASTSSRLS